MHEEADIMAEPADITPGSSLLRPRSPTATTGIPSGSRTLRREGKPRL